MAVTISVYDSSKLNILNSTFDLVNDTIKLALLNSSAVYTSTNTVFSDVSANELATANGYTAGGSTLASKTVTNATSTSKWTAANVSWTASGGSIGPANNAVLYDTTAGNKLIAFIAFGGANTAGDGTNFNVNWNASGIFTLS